MKKGFLTLAALAVSAVAMAQFTPGRLAVVVVGDGTSSLGTDAFPAFIQEYTTTGTPGITVALPTAAAGSNRQFTLSGSVVLGFLNRSSNGQFLSLIGYDAAPTTPLVARTDSATVNRVVARIAANGTVDTSTAMDGFGGDNGTQNASPRAAVSVNGSAFWTTGNSATAILNAGVRYSTLGGSTSQVSSTIDNLRCAKIYNGQLYVTSGTALLTGIGTVGTGLPTGSGETINTFLSTASTQVTGGPFASPYDFYFADANTCYIADDRNTANNGGVQKWTYDGANWNLAYVLNDNNTVGGVRAITGVTNGGTTTLYFTTVSTLYSVVDTGVASAFTVLATAATNTGFRGVAWVPENTSPTIINPTSVNTIEVGSAVNGTISSLLASDDVRWEWRPGPVGIATLNNIRFSLNGNAPGTNPSNLTITVESSATATNIRQTVEVWKYSGTPGWTTLEITSTPHLPVSPDRVVTLTIANPSDYIDGSNGNQVRVRLMAKNMAAVAIFPWRYRVDRLFWTYTP